LYITRFPGWSFGQECHENGVLMARSIDLIQGHGILIYCFIIKAHNMER